MDKFYNEYKVQRFDVDRTNHIRVSRLLDYLIDASTDHYEKVLDDYRASGGDLEDQANLGWVIIQYDMNIHRLPKSGEKFTVETVSTGYSKAFVNRDFKVLDEEGQVLLDMTSIWVVLNLEERKMVRLTDDLMEPFGYGEDMTRPKRGQMPEFDEEKIDQRVPYKVRYFDIDSNNHVNNAIYFTWMFDALDEDFLDQYVPAELTIKYEKEVFYGTEVESQVYTMEEDEGVRTFHRVVSDEEHARAEVLWKKA